MTELAPIMNDRNAAANNTKWLQAAINRGDTPVIPVGGLYVNDVITTPAKVGCGRIATKGSGGYYMPQHPTLFGSQSVICQLKPKSPIFRLSGAGFIATEPLGLWGDGQAAAIEVEGRTSPATGRHRFANLILYNWQSCFRALGGYYYDDEGKRRFKDEEQHADNCSVSNCEAFDCDRWFWSQNQQAVNWMFDGCVSNFFGPPRMHRLADIERGGLVSFTNHVFCVPQVTFFRVRDYSPNTAKLVCRDFEFDRTSAPDAAIVPLEYVGPPECSNYADYYLQVRGFACQKIEAKNKIPADMPTKHHKISLETIYTN